MDNLRKGILVRNGVCVGAVGDKNFSTLHVGCVIPFAGNADNIPRGYLLADGASYPTADYPDLYAVIGNTYGGDTENFNVPNLVDKFIQGSTTSGEEKEAGLPNITGSFVPWGYQNNLSPSGAFSQSRDNVSAYEAYGSSKGSQINFNASQSNSIYGNSNTVQPPALTMVYIIKAFHTNEGTDSGVSDDVVEYVDNKVDGLISDTTTSSTVSTWSSSKIASEIDNAILVKDIIYQGAITANQRKILGNVGIHVDKIISISKIFGDTVEGWDYGVAQMTNVGELVYMPTTTSESTFIQYKIAYRE